MTAEQALRRLLDGPTDDRDVHETLLAAGLLQMTSGTGPTWVLNARGLAAMEALR
jgi:hypothetical protein